MLSWENSKTNTDNDSQYLIKAADLRHYICDKGVMKLEHSRSDIKHSDNNFNCYSQFQSTPNPKEINHEWYSDDRQAEQTKFKSVKKRRGRLLGTSVTSRYQKLKTQIFVKKQIEVDFKCPTSTIDFVQYILINLFSSAVINAHNDIDVMWHQQ